MWGELAELRHGILVASACPAGDQNRIGPEAGTSTMIPPLIGVPPPVPLEANQGAVRPRHVVVVVGP